MSSSPMPALPRPHHSLPVRFFNGAGRMLRRWGWQRPLDADRILRSASGRAGHSDFGPLDVREGLLRLVTSLEQENRLTPFGRLLIRHALTQLAEARLRVQAALRKYPEILKEQVIRPIFVLGMPRTGTTLLHRLLSQDPDSRALYLWELNRPTPQPDQQKLWHTHRTRWQLVLFTRYLAPWLNRIHPLEPGAPEECTTLLLNTFRATGFGHYGQARGFRTWVEDLGEVNTHAIYREYRKQLQLLQWRCPPRHWILKSPLHTRYLDALLCQFPDACIIQNHRHLAEVIPSTCSHRLANLKLYSDGVDPSDLGVRACKYLVDRLLRPAQRIRAAHPGRVFDVLYPNLVRDPIGTVHAIYDHFGLRVSTEMENNMRRWLACNPQNKHGQHRYSLEQFGLDRATVDRLFPGYPECFGQQAEALRV